jgi:hypothetical protein
VIQDNFPGQDAEASKIFSLNLMAQGEVDTPAGRRSPPLRTHKPNNDLPSVGEVFPLQPGLNRLGFTGQWLIDWDLYTLTSQAQEAQIGNWAHSWHPSREQSEFAKATGRAFEERQHILRIKGQGPFKVFILPFRKGERRNDLQVQQNASSFTIATRDATTIVNDSFYAYADTHRRMLTTFSAQPTEANGISAAGGPVEIIVEQQQAIITAHGQKGMRQMTLPGTWKIKDPQGLKAPLAFRAGVWILDYQGEASLTVTLKR